MVVFTAILCIPFSYFWTEAWRPVPAPDELRYYPEDKVGFLEFDPITILDSIDRGEKNLFQPLEGFYSDTEYVPVLWTQAEYLRVANALSQQVWNEPLDLEQWNVLQFEFAGGGCRENVKGFFVFEIVYYKTIKSGWKTVYAARKISLVSTGSTASWAGEYQFSANFFERWRKIELVKFKITAEEAYQLAEESGGRTAWSNDKDGYCQIFVEAEAGWLRDTWFVNYSGNPFSASIDPFTGKINSTK